MIAAILALGLLLPAVELDLAGYGPPRTIASLENPEISEASGLAASLVAPDRYWLINDSGNAPALFAVDRSGATLARATIDGVTKNVDWEALDTFELDGRPYLIVGDVGDNQGVREETTLYIVEEPVTLPVDTLTIAWRLRLRLPTGATDVESLFVDPVERRVYLLTKRKYPAVLWSVPLEPKARGVATARREGVVSRIPRPTDADLAEDPRLGQYRGQPTDASMHPDRTGVAVLTYGDAYWFPRREGKTWAEALALDPWLIELPTLRQAEGTAFSADGSTLLVTSEGTPAPLVELQAEMR
ncbi:MAG: hypothetical protein AAGE01_09740 [Pseudomonadota bacterium]